MMTFVSSGENPDIRDTLKEALRLVDPQLENDLVDDEGLVIRGAAIAGANQLALIDGHGNYSHPGLVDGLDLGGCPECPRIIARVVIVGCCWSGSERFRTAVTRNLCQRTVYLGYDSDEPDKQTPVRHAKIVFPPVLRSLLACQLQGTPEDLKETIHTCLQKLRSELPQWTTLKPWRVEILDPAPGR